MVRLLHRASDLPELREKRVQPAAMAPLLIKLRSLLDPYRDVLGPQVQLA